MRANDPPDLNTLLTEIARAGSLSGAARHFQCSAPTLRKWIAAAEAQVGLPLVETGPGGTILTVAGGSLLTHGVFPFR